MIDLNDELLGAYLDDELGEETRAQVEAELSADGGARVRLERLRAADAAVRAAFPLQPVAAVRALEPAPHEIPVLMKVGYRRRAIAMTALAAGVCGLVLGPLLRDAWFDGPVAPVTTGLADVRLAAVLEREPSGSVIKAGDRELRVTFSFRAADGRACRQYASYDAASGGEGVACHGDAGWQIVAWDATAGAPSSTYRMADAGAAMDAAIERLGGGAALDAQAEQALRDAHWRVR